MPGRFICMEHVGVYGVYQASSNDMEENILSIFSCSAPFDAYKLGSARGNAAEALQ